jgi:hypothetical protein
VSNHQQQYKYRLGMCVYVRACVWVERRTQARDWADVLFKLPFGLKRTDEQPNLRTRGAVQVSRMTQWCVSV